MQQILPDGTTITVIHYMFWKDNQDWRIACMPNVTVFHKTRHQEALLRSNDTRAVSCPACKKTVAYNEAQRRER